MGRPSIAPEMLLRATLLQAFFSVRSERMLMEQINYNLLFRWFVGLPIDAEVWHPTVFTHNRDRLMEGEVAHEFLVALPQVKKLLSSEHFSVDEMCIRDRLDVVSRAAERCFVERYSRKAAGLSFARRAGHQRLSRMAMERAWASSPSAVPSVIAASPSARNCSGPHLRLSLIHI